MLCPATINWSLRSVIFQLVFDRLPVLAHEPNSFEFRDVGDGIAGDDSDVGKLSGFDCPHTTLPALGGDYFFSEGAVPPGTVPSNLRISPFRPTAQP